MGKIVFGAIMPHPPLLVEEVGRSRLKEVDKSAKACQAIAQHVAEQKVDALVVITPHGKVGRASIPVYTGHIFEGSFVKFGVSKPIYSFKGDSELGRSIIKDCDLASSCPETLLDHGILVPMYYFQRAGIKKPILPIAIGFLPLKKLFEFGQSLAKTISTMDRKVAIVASADMSHRLTQDAPAGYSPRGKVFDDKLVELVKNNDVKGILEFDPALADEAGQDALWSIAILLGALDGLNLAHELLSYEGPFGVGYMVVSFKKQ